MNGDILVQLAQNQILLTNILIGIDKKLDCMMKHAHHHAEEMEHHFGHGEHCHGHDHGHFHDMMGMEHGDEEHCHHHDHEHCHHHGFEHGEEEQPAVAIVAAIPDTGEVIPEEGEPVLDPEKKAALLASINSGFAESFNAMENEALKG